MRKSAVAVLFLVMLSNFGAWAFANRPASERPWAGLISGVALSPYQADQNPIEGKHPGPDDIERDMSTLEGHVKSVRKLQFPQRRRPDPQAARRHGLNVTQGAWIQGIPEDEAEIANLVRLTRQNPNIRRVLVGNEAILRTDDPCPSRSPTSSG